MGIFGEWPATGVIARTATKCSMRRAHTIAGIILHSRCCWFFRCSAAGETHPLAALSAVLIVVSLRMGKWQSVPTVESLGREATRQFLFARSLTVALILPTAVGASRFSVGIARATAFGIDSVHADEEVTQANASGQKIVGKNSAGRDGVPSFWRILFLAGGQIGNVAGRAGQLPDVLILRMRDVLAWNATGLDALEDLLEKLRIKKKDLLLCGPHSQPMIALVRAGFIDRLGMENVCADMDISLERARNSRRKKKILKLSVGHKWRCFVICSASGSP